MMLMIEGKFGEKERGKMEMDMSKKNPHEKIYNNKISISA